MNTLPSEIIAMIADHLTIRQVLDLGAVCHAYHDLIHSVYADKVRHTRDLATHKARLQPALSTIAAGYYAVTNNNVGLISHKLVGGRYFKYIVCDRDNHIAGMRLTATSLNQNVFRMIWTLHPCEFGAGNHLQYHALCVSFDNLRIQYDADEFEKYVTENNDGNPPERY